MDRFDAMRLYARVVERRSFTLAAGDMEVPRSTVTKVIADLERRLGVRLLQRTTRVVRPTLDGEAYYRRCVRLLADGMSNAGIGKRLFISESTVKFHIRNVIRKLRVSKRTDAVYVASKRGLI